MSAKSAIKFLAFFILCASALADFEDHFKDCHPNVPGFDVCMREALNSIRPYFKTGVRKYNIDPFDPFFAREISVSRGLNNLGFTLTLRNVTETGWSASKLTKFVSDLPNHKIVYTQSFPEKALNGDYEFVANVLGTAMTNKGKFTLTLYNLMQTSTISRPPNQKLKAEIDVQSIGNLKLHITNLLRGRSFLEGVLDRIINSTWKQGFPITRGVINELVSKAFTEIFGKSFQNFNFEKLIKTKSEDRYGTFAT